jgi:hypothetical protein
MRPLSLPNYGVLQPMIAPCLDPSKVSLKDIFGRCHRLLILSCCSVSFSRGWAAMASAAMDRALSSPRGHWSCAILRQRYDWTCLIPSTRLHKQTNKQTNKQTAKPRSGSSTPDSCRYYHGARSLGCPCEAILQRHWTTTLTAFDDWCHLAEYFITNFFHL